MQLERDDTGIDLVLQSDLLGIATFAYEPEVQRKLVAGLHHLLDVSLACSAVDRSGRCADIVSVRLLRQDQTTYLGPVPPPNSVVMPDESASCACCGQIL